MRKFFTIAMAFATLYASAADTWKSPNDGKVYTMAALAEIEGTGVVKVSDNVYRTVNNIEIQENDGFELTNKITIKIGNKLNIKVFGSANMAPADTATIMGDDDCLPQGVWLAKVSQPTDVKHIRFEKAGLRSGGPAAIIVENCSFYNNVGEGSKNCIGFVAASIGNIIRNCYFEGAMYSAIGSGSNTPAGTLIENCVFKNLSTEGRNYPYINMTVAGNNGDVTIRNNKIIGGKGLMAGAISCANMLGVLGKNISIIENNELSDCRYGINILGFQEARIVGNTIKDCHYENNPNNGGSGITVSSSSTKYECNAYISNNIIDGCLWGVTVIGQGKANLGNITVAETDSAYNPGGNVFRNNGNTGAAAAAGENAWDASKPYDLYNNTAFTIYAQNNTWGCAQQTAEEIEKQIFHKNDNDTLGEVIFMPAAGGAGVGSIVVDNESEAEYYNLQGVKVLNPSNGIYIKRQGNKVSKVLVK